MKKLISLALALLLCLSMFAACGRTRPEPAPTPDITPDTTPDTKPDADLTAADIWDAILTAVGEDKLPAFMQADADMLEGFYGLTSDAYSDVACMTPMMIVHATEICIVRATDADAVQAAFDKRLADLDSTWSMYLPEQYELVQNAQTVTNGEWMLLVVSEYADDIVAAFNAATK